MTAKRSRGSDRLAESTIEAYLKQRVTLLGGMCIKWVSPGAVGVPDRICVFPGGKIVFVEVKAKGGTVSALQDYQQEELRKLGAQVEVVWSADDVDKLCDNAAWKFNSGPIRLI
jgi:hypothetical protein